MEIAIIVILFLVGSVGGAMQALKFVERRRLDAQRRRKPSSDADSDEH
jgi:hypothetical protein